VYLKTIWNEIDGFKNRGIQLLREAHIILAKKRPEELFKGVFFDMKEALKNVKTQYATQAQKKVKSQMIEKLRSRGVNVLSLIIKLGKFKGHAYISSAKLAAAVEDEEAAKNLFSFLQSQISAKYKYKGFKDGVAKYNIR